MPTQEIVAYLLKNCLHELHVKRREALLKAATGLVKGSVSSLYQIASHLPNQIAFKHQIKSVDRLLSNVHIHQSRISLYKKLLYRWLSCFDNLVIIVDWSPLTKNQEWHVLRASIALKGRSLTLYEEVHSREYLGNRNIQHQFLNTLKEVLPEGCKPIIVADSGFKTPWFRQVETLGWYWVGRIRGRDMVSFDNETWIYSHDLHARAISDKAQFLGEIKWVRNHPLKGYLILYKRASKGRKHRNLDGTLSRKRYSLKQADREREPWLLVFCEALTQQSAACIVSIYAQRMQIEQTFRDTKNSQLGLGLSVSRSRSSRRFDMLLLLIHLALFVFYCIGEYGWQTDIEKRFQSTNRKNKREISILTLAKRMLRQSELFISEKAYLNIIQSFQKNVMHWMIE